MHALIENNEIVRTASNLRREFPNVSFPRELPEEYEGWVKVVEAPVDSPEERKLARKEVQIVDGAPTLVPVYEDFSKDELKSHAKEARLAHETGGFTFNNLLIETDEKTERRLIGARVKAEANSNYQVTDWKVGEEFVTLNAATIIAISDALNDHVASAFTHEKTVREEIDAGTLTSPAQVKSRYAELVNGS